MSGAATLRIFLMWYGGIVVEGESSPEEPEYNLVVLDAAGRTLEERSFDNCLALEAYIQRSWPGVPREPLPPVPPEEAASLARIFSLLDRPPEGVGPFRIPRTSFCGALYEWSHSPEVTARLRRELGLPAAS